jgi:hypothetical protein
MGTGRALTRLSANLEASRVLGLHWLTAMEFAINRPPG